MRPAGVLGDISADTAGHLTRRIRRIVQPVRSSSLRDVEIDDAWLNHCKAVLKVDSGGAFAAEGGILIELQRMNRILSIDLDNRFAVVQPGVVNLHISQAAAPYGLYYAPDPSSQMSCSIGGNVAENSGGPHCLKYGMTTNHILAIEAVTAEGEIIRLGNPAGEMIGMDLIGAIVGSEGTFAIVTEITVRLLPKPQAVKTMLAAFHSVEECSQTV